MFSKVVLEFKNMDEKTKKIMKTGINISFIICIIAFILLLVHRFFFTYYDIYKCSFLLFRLGIILVAAFICCAFAINYLKKIISN